MGSTATFNPLPAPTPGIYFFLNSSFTPISITNFSIGSFLKSITTLTELKAPPMYYEEMEGDWLEEETLVVSSCEQV